MKKYDRKSDVFQNANRNHKRFLPWQYPKSNKEDPKAHQHIEAIMAHPNYIQADRDPDFLRCDDVRGVRLEVDYLKPELLLKSHGVEHTIVVFGSTHIVEESEVKRRLEKLEEKTAQEGKSSETESELRVLHRLLAKSRYYDMAREFGQIVGRSGRGPNDARLTLTTGGGPGIMEAANRGAFDVGAKSIGLNITLPHEQFPNPYITPELCFQIHYFAIRKLHFLRRAKALVIFPGGYGTLDESFELLTLVQTEKIDPMPIIFVGESYWRSIVNFDILAEEGVIDPEDLDIFTFADSAREAWDAIWQWYGSREEGLWGSD